MTPNDSAGLADLTGGGNNLFKVESSWFSATETGLENTLVTLKDTGSNVDPISLISVETCVLLKRRDSEDDQSEGANKDEKCSISLQGTGNAVICSLSILSEARMIEVHGPCDEYLSTVRAEFLLEMEETLVYCADIKLEHSSNYLSLKLNRSSRDSDLWIYGLIVHWKNDLGILQNNSSIENRLPNSPFSHEAINRRLNQVGQDLSVNAQQYKQFLEMCSLRSRDSAGGDGHSSKPPLTSLLASMFQGTQRRDGGTIPPNLESLLDQKLVQLETRMLAAIDQRLQDMEKKQQALINDTFEKLMMLNLDLISRLNLKECSNKEQQIPDTPSS